MRQGPTIAIQALLRWSSVLVSSVCGGIAGLYLAVLLPVMVAFVLNHDPVHRGFYLETAWVLLYVLPAGLGICMGVLSFRRRAPLFRRVFLWIGTAFWALTVVILPDLFVRGGPK
jgi:hypothetical protein